LWGPVSHTIVRVAHLHRRLAGDLLRQVGLHPGQELLLMLLWDQDDRPQSELVGLLGVEAPTVTKTLQRLEQQGLVARHRPAANRRTVVVSLTDRGRSLHREVQQLWAALEEATTASLTETERQGLSQLLARVEKDLADGQNDDERIGDARGRR
jgi:DNA-binding MarR family transcriptional regulator